MVSSNSRFRVEGYVTKGVSCIRNHARGDSRVVQNLPALSDGETWSWVPWDLEPRTTALVRASRNLAFGLFKYFLFRIGEIISFLVYFGLFTFNFLLFIHVESPGSATTEDWVVCPECYSHSLMARCRQDARLSQRWLWRVLYYGL
jgi:hypothetical protein